MMDQRHRPFSRRTPIVIILALICVGLVVGGYKLAQTANDAETSGHAEATPTLQDAGHTPPPLKTTGVDTLTILKNNFVPAGDWRDAAIRLKGIPDIPEVVQTAPASYAPGERTDFYVLNADTREVRRLSAQLTYETQNVYFFVEQGVDFENHDARSLVDEFQNRIYPTNREFFGSEWTPGVDGDPHLYILYARGLGKYTQAYCDSASEFSQLAHPYSNEKEIVVLNADAGPLADDYWRATLAHEFQHMIHWNQNRNAELWLNEGASMLAESINGYDTGPQTSFFTNPNLQLNSWVDLSSSSVEAVGHYDAAYLFMQYFFDRFGREAIQTLVADRTSGMAAVDSTLAALGLTELSTGKLLTAEDVFADWVVANYLNDSRLAQGQYAYNNYADKIPGPTDTITECPTSTISASVHQFGTRYIELTCPGSTTIDFSGSPHVSLVPTQPHSGTYAMWSSREDQSDTTLTREFDLRFVKSATLNYWAWWEIEKDFDYAYVEVSADNGKTWEIIQTPSGTGANPTGGNLGWGYTGCSGGGEPGEGCSAAWIGESMDLSKYAGKKILLRFEYITDAALSYPSFMLDDISVPEISYNCSFEDDACGWESNGFVRVDNVLPQTFVVQLIHESAGRTTIQRLQLDSRQHGSLSLNLIKGDLAILAISGTTPFTTEEAQFELEITP